MKKKRRRRNRVEWKLMSSHTQALVLVQALVFDPLIEEEEEQDIICHSKK